MTRPLLQRGDDGRTTTMAALTDEQLDEIRRHLDEGMTPDAIADYLGQVADLDLMDIVTIRSAAVALSRGETP
ncbi:MAG: hypothetical protein EOP32_38025 [Rhodococcus sp. (in: high G+C Gram-positive bacteria)]|nr:MAG: hypothetical protein EOP32_38025 [Rhodococcus sp. (in: high G+C Gram-positive bacteria)]